MKVMDDAVPMGPVDERQRLTHGGDPSGDPN